MSKNEMIAFRNAINGYNKSDVNEYIQKLNSEFADYEKKSSAVLESVRLELENTKKKAERLDELRATCDEALQLCAEKDQLIKEQGESISALNEKIRQQGEQLAALTAERDNLAARAQEMDERLRRLAGASSKSERYDEISSQLGELIITAKKTANEIVDSAKSDADKMKEEIGARLTAAKEEAADKARSALHAISQILRTMVENALSEISVQVKSAQDDMSALLADLEDKNQRIDDQISTLRCRSTEEIRQELARINLDGCPDPEHSPEPGEKADINPYLNLTETREI